MKPSFLPGHIIHLYSSYILDIKMKLKKSSVATLAAQEHITEDSESHSSDMVVSHDMFLHLSRQNSGHEVTCLIMFFNLLNFHPDSVRETCLTM